MTGARTDRRHDGGFVLIAVLSVLALLSAMVVVLSGLSRGSVDTAKLSSIETRRQAILQAGLSLAAYELLHLGLAMERVNGQQFRLDDGTITLAVSTDAGKVDLNASGRNLLAAAYTAAGLTALTPQDFAGRVIDWRDGDENESENGAEAPAYAEAGFDYRPRNGAFRNIDDLRWVMGVSSADIEVLRPYLTIYNPRGRLNSYAAPEALIAALPRVASETVGEVLLVRAEPGADASEKLDDLLLVQASLVDTVPPVTYRIGILAQLKGVSKAQQIEAVIASGVAPGSPFHVLYVSGNRR